MELANYLRSRALYLDLDCEAFLGDVEVHAIVRREPKFPFVGDLPTLKQNPDLVL